MSSSQPASKSASMCCVRIWDARKGALLLGPPPHGEAVWQAIFSPDGKWIASSDNHKPGS